MRPPDSVVSAAVATVIDGRQVAADVRRRVAADAQALHDGTLDLSVGFMRGQVKMAGDFGALLKFLPLTGGLSPRVSVAEMLPG